MYCYYLYYDTFTILVFTCSSSWAEVPLNTALWSASVKVNLTKYTTRCAGQIMHLYVNSNTSKEL